MNFDWSYKIVVVGASGVGKTCILLRLVDGTFDPGTESTIGIEYRSHILTIEAQSIKLNIWDTAGQERFRSVSRTYFREAIGAILVFALDSSESFEELTNWLADLQQYATPNAAILMVGNKSDLTSARKITAAEAESFAHSHHLTYLETSALDGTNINESFFRLAKAIRDKVRRGEILGDFQAPKAPQISDDDLSCPC
jgi:small GTP-binding protein